MKKLQSKITIPSQAFGEFKQNSITVSLVKNPEDLKRALPQNFYKTYLDLHEQVRKKPKSCIAKIEEIHKNHPHSDEITNLLTYAYLKLRKIKKAKKLITKNYHDNPSSLLAKINYGEQCLQQKKHDEIPLIFEDCFDLTDLYPKQKEFHVFAYRGFLNLMGHYHLVIGKKETASYYHLLSHKIDPDFPGTKLLGKKLYQTSWWKSFRAAFKRRFSFKSS